MASDLEIQRLARLARALNPDPRMPPLILVTDDIRLADPIRAAAVLPRGCAVILRHRDPEGRSQQARQLRKITRERGVMLLIAQDADLARSTGADGLHLPERLASSAAHWKTVRPDWFVTTAAHSASAVSAAIRACADAVLLAPVFQTRSHPERAALGVLRAGNVARQSRVPVYALGGVNHRNVMRLAGSALAGIAAIESLSPDHNR
jgi:thiamine-phosphate pyrophosphorylase